jgi:hypothetical protein
MVKTFIACIALTASVGAAYAAAELEGPKMVFDATYTTTGPTGSSTVRMISDGKGHMRTESSAGGQKFVSIMDYPAKEAITLIEATHMAMKSKLKAAGPDVHDADTAKKAGAKPLGAKVVNGHPSHGWETTTASGKSETWTGDDIHYLVKSETTTPQGKMTMELKSFSNAAPSADAFKVPAGYKEMVIPGQ